MARYELDTQFREVLRDGETITFREGTLGLPGTERTHTYVSALDARQHLDEYVRPLLAAGYRRIDAEPRCDDVPDDDDARLVLADILQLRGDPRGELIVMQSRGVDADELVEAHAAQWFGDLALGWRYLDARWRLGWLQRVTLRPSTVLAPLMPNTRAWKKVPLLLEALFDAPVARALEELAVEELWPTFVPSVMLAIVKAPPTLRALEIDGVLDLGALQVLRTALWPRLHTLAFALDPDADGALRPILARQCMPALAKLVITTQDPTRLARTIAMNGADHDILIRSHNQIDRDALPPDIRFELRQG